jgi:autotransporter-associated beta strand protein
MDLNGYDQSFGDLRQQGYSATTYPPSTNGLIFSERPATMYVWQNTLNSDEGNNVVTGGWRARYQGAVSLEKSGPKHLILGGYSTTTGRLTVVEGRLSFAGNGAWPNASEIVVKGGVLAIDSAARVKEKAIYRLSPDGKLDLAAGVTVLADELYVPNGEGGWTLASAGRYTAANAPSLISGEGVLIVRRHGIVVTFR